LSAFRNDALERLSVLQGILRRLPEVLDFNGFTTQVHALKSAAGTIGAAELSQEAAELENIGKAGDTDAVKEKLPGFYEHLKETAESIGAARAEKAQIAENDGGTGLNLSDTGIHGLFDELKNALEAKDMEAIDRLIGELMGKGLDKKTINTINAVSDLLLLSRFKDAAERLMEDHV
jgi:HPt (histidine-containing phosphotransfer) domain-containing protein